MRKHFFFFGASLIYLLSVSAAFAQLSSSQLKSGLQKLEVTGSVLYIAAHPDDENTRLLSYLANERKVRTGYLSLTRGDGGQNLIGTEQAEELGLIRTQELLAARKIDGAEQFFTRANDFGFSKTAEETFRIWDKERILGDVVWVIRKFRPDVIITRFPGDARAGHGHHTASSILAQEAFRAAADPTRFPEQLQYVGIWQAKRIFWNTFNFGGNNTTSQEQLKINVGVYNPLLGKDYGEMAAESRSQHKSQGFGVAAQRGEAIEYFSLLAGEAAATDILEGVNTSWNRIPGTSAVSDQLKKINREYTPEKPELLLPELLKLHKLIGGVNEQHWKLQKLKELNELILAAAGIWCEAVATQPSFALGEKVSIRINAISRYQNIDLDVNDSANVSVRKLSLKKSQLNSAETSLTATRLSQPYWLAEKHPVGAYVVDDLQKIGFPENPDGLQLRFSFNFDDQKISVLREVSYKFTDQVRGELYKDLQIVPPVTATLETSGLFFTNDKAQRIRVLLRSYKASVKGEIRPSLPAGWKAQPSAVSFDFENKGDEQSIEFAISPGHAASSGILSAQVKVDGQVFSKAIKTIDYSHIPSITYFPDAEARLVRLNLKTEGKRIGYLMGAGDKIPESLKAVGYEVAMLDESRVMNGDLSEFDAIIAGVRLYNVDARIRVMNKRLLDYVEKGGVLLVQYNVNQPLLTDKIGPFPFTITRGRVTEEDAKVTILDPSHPVFTYPNKITGDDFSGWIQERGIYSLSNFDENYKPLLEMSDSNEAPQNGSLVVTDYGKGRFVYTGLAFFRQLPAAVPGAYRLFVNLITKPKK